MTAIFQQTQKHSNNLLILRLIGALFVLIALVSTAALLLNVQRYDTFFEFIDNAGIILPVGMVSIAVFSIWVCVGLLRQQRTAATWGQFLVSWLGILGILYLILRILPSEQSDRTNLSATDLVTLFVIETVLWGIYWGLRRYKPHLKGHEDLFAQNTYTAWNLLVPTLILLFVVAGRPLERTFISSLTDRQFARPDEPVHFVGFDNYVRLLSIRLDRLPCEVDTNGDCIVNNGETEFPSPRQYLDASYTDNRYRVMNNYDTDETRYLVSVRDRDFWNAVNNTLVFTVGSVAIELVLGLFIAILINSQFRGRGIIRAAMLLPWAIPTAVSARLWAMIYRDSQSGVFNYILINLGVIDQSKAWLAASELQIPALMFISIWKTTPFMVLLFMAGLQVIPEDLYEAAKVDGANKLRQTFSITLPLLRPTIAIALIFRTLDALRVFDIFQVLLAKQRLSLATYNYDTLIFDQQFGYASAVGVVIFMILLVFAAMYIRMMRLSEDD